MSIGALISCKANAQSNEFSKEKTEIKTIKNIQQLNKSIYIYNFEDDKIIKQNVICFDQNSKNTFGVLTFYEGNKKTYSENRSISVFFSTIEDNQIKINLVDKNTGKQTGIYYYLIVIDEEKIILIENDNCKSKIFEFVKDKIQSEYFKNKKMDYEN